MRDWQEGFFCGVLAALPNVPRNISLDTYCLLWFICIVMIAALIFRPWKAP